MISEILSILDSQRNPTISLELFFSLFILTINFFFLIVSLLKNKVSVIKKWQAYFDTNNKIKVVNLSIVMIIIFGVIIRCNYLWDKVQSMTFMLDEAVLGLFSFIQSLNSLAILVFVFVLYRFFLSFFQKTKG